jgi:hypothetical protein
VILDTTWALQVVLGGAVTTNELEVMVDYIVHTPSGVTATPATSQAASSGASDVTILAAPTKSAESREPIRVSIYNKDTVNATPTVKLDNGTTERIVIKAVLATLETLHFEKGRGWYSTDANGAIKTV